MRHHYEVWVSVPMIIFGEPSRTWCFNSHFAEERDARLCCATLTELGVIAQVRAHLHNPRYAEQDDPTLDNGSN